MKHTQSSRRLPRTLRAAASLLSAVALIGMPGINPAATAQDTLTEAVIYDGGDAVSTADGPVEDDGADATLAGEDGEVVVVDGEAPTLEDEAPEVTITEDGEVILPGVQDAEAGEAQDADAPKVRRPRSITNPPYNRPLPAISPNPELPRKCGLNIALVFDLSASIDQTEQRQSRQAARELVNALEGTDSRVGLFSFATEAYENGSGHTGTREEVEDLQREISNIRANYSNQNFYGGTNWEGALKKVADSGQSYDVVYFITDGRPTATNPESAAKYPYRFNGPTLRNARNPYSTAADNTIAGGLDANYTDVKQAIKAANELKEKGTRIQAIGVGMPDSIELLNDGYSTGPVAFSRQRAYINQVNWGGQFGSYGTVDRSRAVYDVTSAEDMLAGVSSPDAVSSIRSYDDLKRALTEAASELCNPSITVRKEIVDENGQFLERGADWTFNISGRGVLPDDADPKTTGKSGAVSWLTEKGEFVTIAEEQKPGFSVHTQRGMNAKCYQNVTYPDGHVGQKPILTRNDGREGFQVQMPTADNGAVVCTIQNKQVTPGGGFAVTKKVVGSGKNLSEIRDLNYNMRYYCWPKGTMAGNFDAEGIKDGALNDFTDGTRQAVKDIPVGSTCWLYEKNYDLQNVDGRINKSVSYSGEGVSERPVDPSRNNGISKVAEFTVGDETDTIAVLVQNRFDSADFHIQKLAADPVDYNPHSGNTVTVAEDGTVSVQYKIRVENRSDMPGNAGKITDTFTVPAGLKWDDGKTASFEILDAPGGPRRNDIKDFQSTATEEQLASGFTVASGINDFPGRGAQEILVTIPLKLDLTESTNGTVYDENAENLSACRETSYRGMPYIKSGRGIVNTTALEGENPRATLITQEDNQACVPIKVDPKWESSKQASNGEGGFADAGGPGATITPDSEGNITALYRIKVTNTSKVAAPNTDVMEDFTLPKGFELTKAEIAYNRADTTPDDGDFFSIDPRVFADESGTAHGVQLLLTEDYEKCRYINEPSLPVERAGQVPMWCRNTPNQQMTAAGGSFYYFIKVTARAEDGVTKEDETNAGECENTGTGKPGKGFYNFVSLPGEDEPQDDNDACVPVKFPKLEISKAVHVEDNSTFYEEGAEGKAISVDENGRFSTVFRISVKNVGEVPADIPTFTDTMNLPDGFTVEKVQVTESNEGTFLDTDDALADADTVTPKGNTITFRSKKECEAGAGEGDYCSKTETVLPATTRYYFVAVTARGDLKKPEAWKAIGECEGSQGDFTEGKGFVNAVDMPAYPNEPSNDNEVCVPVNKPGWKIEKAPANSDKETYPEGFGPDGGTGSTVSPGEDGNVTIDYRIRVTNTGTAEQKLPEFTDKLTLPAGYELVSASIAHGTQATAGPDAVWVEVVPKDGVVTITQDEAKCAEGLSDRYCGAEGEDAVAPTVSYYFFFSLVARASEDITPEQIKKAGKCETEGEGVPGSGFFNRVDLPGETGGSDDNDACVPVEPGNGTIEVVKFNLDGNLQLPGAEFTLYHDKDGELDPGTAMVLAPKKVEGTSVTDTKEEADLATGFKSGDLKLDKIYWLAETRAPYSEKVGSFELLPEPMRFKLTADGIAPWDGEKFLPAGNDQKAVLGKSFVITNTAVHVHDVRRGELPKAGGIGHWTLAGGAGMLIAFSLLMAYRTPATRRTR